MPMFILACILILLHIIDMIKSYRRRKPRKTFFGQLCFVYGIEIASAVIKDMEDAGLLSSDDLLRIYLLK